MATTITIPSLTDSLIAKIQSRIATFLLCREKLTKLARHIDVKIAGSATKLLVTQTELETKLSSVLNEINSFSFQTDKVNWNFNDITDIGSFYYNLERHINGTNELQKQAGTNVPGTMSTTLTGGYFWMCLSAGLLIYLIIKR